MLPSTCLRTHDRQALAVCRMVKFTAFIRDITGVVAESNLTDAVIAMGRSPAGTTYVGERSALQKAI